MRNCGIVVPEYYGNERLFDIDDDVSNRDNNLYHWFLLKNELFNHAIELTTYNKAFHEKYDILIFPDFPSSSQFNFNIDSQKGKDLYLILFESELIKPSNWDLNNHKYFKKIFTWNDNIVDNKKYIKYSWPNKIPTKYSYECNKKNKFCAMIVSHKMSTHPLELYSERLNAIRWFEKYYPHKFDLYGLGWDKQYFKGVLSKLNRFDVLRTILRPKIPSYKGIAKSKREILQTYKYAICYENAKDIPGYITEKIFDCFFAGCVPIYLGAPNITDHIPSDTFIDKRQFPTYESLYKYMAELTHSEYNTYLKNIDNYLKSNEIQQYSAEKYVTVVSSHILNA